MGTAQVCSYYLYQHDDHNHVHSPSRKYHASLKFLYTVTLKRPFEVEFIPRHRGKPGLLIVMSGSEVQSLFAAMHHPKYRVIAIGNYSAGLRIREACGLRVADIDSKRGLIHVYRGKGGKDRYVMLSQKYLLELREYWK